MIVGVVLALGSWLVFRPKPAPKPAQQQAA